MIESRAATEFLPRPPLDGETETHALAYARLPGAPDTGPGIVFCGGFRSDMTGTKAVALEMAARERGRACLRFDYYAHGRSSGAFSRGSIGRWLDDTLAALDTLTEGPQILVGSSMGGWLATLAALARPQRCAGLVLIAPALDFTEALMWAQMTPEQRARLEREGVLTEPSHYADQPYEYHLHLIREGRRHLLLDQSMALPCPVRILQGMQDPDVPWQHALRTIEAFAGGDTRLTLLKDGDHRLSRPQDIALLLETVWSL